MNLIAANAYADPPNQTDLMNRAIAARERGDELNSQGNPSGSLEAYQESLRLYNQMTNPPAGNRAVVYNDIADTLSFLGRHADAALNYMNAADLYGRETAPGRTALQRSTEENQRAMSRHPGHYGLAMAMMPVWPPPGNGF